MVFDENVKAILKSINEVPVAQMQQLPHWTTHTLAKRLNFTNDIVVLIGAQDKFLTLRANIPPKWIRSTTCSTATKTSSRPH